MSIFMHEWALGEVEMRRRITERAVPVMRTEVELFFEEGGASKLT